MAQIDLKNCDVFLEDGYTGPSGIGSGLINNGGGYAPAAVTITVDGFTGAVVTGDLFTIAGDVDSHGDLVAHTITSHSQTMGATTSITFTPAIVTSVVDDAALVFLPHQLKIRIGDGNISWTEKRPIVYVKDRGLLDTVRLGDQEPVEVKFDATWTNLSSPSGTTVPTIEEFLKKAGPAAAFVSSSADPCEPYAVDIVVVDTPPCTTPIETYVLSDFRYEDLGHDLKTGQIAITGKCNVFQINAFRSPT